LVSVTRAIWRFREGFPRAKIGWGLFLVVIDLIPIVRIGFVLIFVLVLATFVVTGRPGILLAGV
jgi:hypothetical protein